MSFGGNGRNFIKRLNKAPCPAYLRAVISGRIDETMPR